MRIQHNIMAMNAYRNYNTNTSALSKNLEKLSSGYKINRAGDDAAGLAISEKMRAQISGLNAASKNVKDGISLVKTAEGAMQEIQDMLNRMKYLATQSANGTYDNDVDRFNLQKEVDSLSAEIDRIADSANFNGINLLDGNMGFGAAGGAGDDSAATFYEATAKVAGTDVTGADVAETPAATAKYTYKIDTALATGDTDITIAGKKFNVGTNAGELDITANTTAAAQAGALKTLLEGDADFKAAYDVTVAGDTITVTKKVAGVDGDAATMKGAITVGSGGTATGAGTATEATVGADKVPAHKTYDLSGTLAAGDEITVNGKTYTFDAAAGTTDATKFKDLADLKTKLDADGVTMDDTTNTAVTFTKKAAAGGGNQQGNITGKGEITLQIGDTADGFNQLKVKIGDMHVSALGKRAGTADVGDDGKKTGTYTYADVADGASIADIDISTIDGAQTAINVIKDAINYVSSVRGDLGATQNRLEHTANNLSVMTENIQDAESTIRDTDVAEEMMSYTKNNILIQSAQAMLAQANQVPQGVLQLLQ